MLEELIGQKIVVDLRSTFVCLGTLLRVGQDFQKIPGANLLTRLYLDLIAVKFVSEEQTASVTTHS